MIGDSPEVSNFHRLFLKLHRFINQQPPVLPKHWMAPFVLFEYNNKMILVSLKLTCRWCKSVIWSGLSSFLKRRAKDHKSSCLILSCDSLPCEPHTINENVDNWPLIYKWSHLSLRRNHSRARLHRTVKSDHGRWHFLMVRNLKRSIYKAFGNFKKRKNMTYQIYLCFCCFLNPVEVFLMFEGLDTYMQCGNTRRARHVVTFGRRERKRKRKELVSRRGWTIYS
jgi:hypothetical protein